MSMPFGAEQQGQGGVIELLRTSDQYPTNLLTAIGTVSTGYVGENVFVIPDTEPTTPPGGGPSKKLF